MTIVQMLLLVLGILIVGYVAYWVIMKFFSDPIRIPALAVVGILLLLILLSQFFPEAAGMRVWR